MNNIEFKVLVDKYFTLKMHENGWHGTSQNFRKLDEKYLIKMFGIYKDLKEDSFMCTLSLDFDLSPDFPKNINKSLNNSNALFLNTLTPTRVSDMAYKWPLSEDHNQNIQLIDSIWQAISTHGNHFYKHFKNFPHPFDQIAPSEFEHDKSVKLLNQYYVWDQIGFMRLLKDINLFIGNNIVAKQFSEIAIYRVEKILKSKAATLGKLQVKHFENLIKTLAI